ncbi:MAG TPA: hypothetical protein VGR61_11025 [Candidatus Dormibacteraeota bacterium]|nr:hypothetical protein [Candidatus Dormibacteraeota bacterium]
MPVTATAMSPSNLLRRGEQSGQMLVSVIVLLILMFFIGSAMALAVSSSLHTIAQTNSMDSTAYAAESAVAQGLAGNRRALALNIANVGAGGTTTWSYAYEVVAASGTLAGRSPEQSDTNGSNVLDSNNYETITIPYIAGATFEVYRTAVAAGGNPSTKGFIGTVKADTSGNGSPLVMHDTGLAVTVVDANCTSHNLSSSAFSRPVNNFALTTSTCRVPVDTDPAAVQMWSAPAQFVPAGRCASQPLTVPDPANRGNFTGFKPGDHPGTVWGVIGWHSVSSKKPAKLNVSIEAGSCAPNDPDPCPNPVTAPGVLYFYCHLDPGTEAKTLYVINVGGAAQVSAFVVRAAPSGTDCVVTTIGQAGLAADEADWLLRDGCVWASAKPTLWNRVLP